MIKKFIPTYYAKSLFDVKIDFFKKIGVKYILTDLDNTLDSYKQKIPTERIKQYNHMLNENGIKLIIISNNKGPRVQSYSQLLNVAFESRAMKPFTRKLNRLLIKNGISKKHSIMVGDQILTDIQCGNQLGVRTLLTDPIVKEDQLTTRFNRMFDKPIRNRLKKHGLLRSWEGEL